MPIGNQPGYGRRSLVKNGGGRKEGMQGIQWVLKKGAQLTTEVLSKLQQMREASGEESEDLIPTLRNEICTSERRKVNNPYKKEEQKDQTILNYHFQQELRKPVTFSTHWKNDTKWIGEKICKKAEGHTRIWLQNPNGITAKDDFRVFRSELDEVRENEIDFLALPESTLNSNNYFVSDRLNVLVKYHLPNSQMCLTSTKGYCRETCYQPGGTLALATDKLAGRYAGKGSDSLG